MKLYSLLVSENTSGAFLYLLVTYANIDYISVSDYALKAIIGSAVWFGFRLLGDYYSKKIKNNHNQKQQP